MPPPCQGAARNDLDVIGEQTPTLRFVLVLGQPGPPDELGGVFFPRFQASKEGPPVLIELTQNIIGNVARQGGVGLRVLDAMEYGGVAQIALLKADGVSHQLIGRIVEILRFEGRRVNGGKT
jgi:hypothetical protein